MHQKVRLNIIVSVFYFIGGLLGLALHDPMTGAPLVWLPTGIAVAALLHYGYKTLPGIALGAFAVVISQSPPTHILSLTLGIPLQVIAGPLQAFVAIWLLRKSGVEDSPFDTLYNLTKFLFICVGFSTIISATPGVAALLINNFIQPDDVPLAWLSWLMVVGLWMIGGLGVAGLVVEGEWFWVMIGSLRF